MGISVFVTCELSAGAAMSARPALEKRRVDQLCAGLHVEYPDERFPAASGSLLAAEAPLVTHNTRDFSRVPDLVVLGY